MFTPRPYIAAGRRAVRLLLTLLALCAGSAATATEPTTMRFDRVTVEDGLSQSSVMAIAQDRAGFMWFATESGLDRYDGYSFKHYRHERGNSGTPGSDFVRDLVLADDGSLWIATDGGGIAQWLPESDSFVTYRHDPADPNSLATDRIRTLLADRDGNIWVGTRGAGLDRLDAKTGRVTHYAHAADDANSLSDNDVYALAVERSGAVWIGTRNGLNRLDPVSGTITRFTEDLGNQGSIGDNQVRSLLIDRNGTLWVGTNSHGLCKFNAVSQTFTHHMHDETDPSTISSNRVDAIFQDDRNRIWVGTDKGLNLLDVDSGSFTRYRNDPTDAASLSGDSIFSIYQDRTGLLWIGTRTSGLSKWNPRSWTFGHYKPSLSGDNSFSNPNITSFTEDADGNAWVGTFGGGINIIDRDSGSVTHLRHDPDNPASLGGDRVMALLTDRRGHIWAGTMTAGLNEIDPNSGRVRNFQNDPAKPDSIAANGVMSLMQDSESRVWVGTFGGGVSRLDRRTGRFTNFGHDPEDPTTLSSSRATAIAQDHAGIVWVGTDGGGLNYYDAKADEWRHVRHDVDNPKSLSADTVYSLHVDARGRLWAGTRNGLDRISGWPLGAEGARVVNVAPVESAAGLAVFGIQSDYTGKLWLSTGQGLVSYNPDSGESTTYHASQGLQGEEFNFGASYASPDGKMYFGGANGFNAFRPAELELNKIPPTVVLTSLSVINEPIATSTPFELIDNISLDYSDYVVTFEMSALDFTAPESNRYAYRLEGFDETWVEAGDERRITYTNLDGGDYVLQVIAANSDGTWNEAGIEIPLAVAYPPWKTWWAYLLYTCVAMLMILGFLRHHEQKLARESEYSRRLEKEVHERTKQLNSRNKDLKVANAKLLEASTTDVLTGLRNRRYLFEQVGKDVDLVLRHYRDGTETMRPGGNNDLLFLMVDLDNFKPVNDNCGHEAGDQLLLQVRDVLLDACRTSDDVIRWGGDEFLVVARDTNRNYAANLAERIRESLSQRVFPVGDGQVARITTSIGYASYPFIKERPELMNWEEVLGIADAAMYEAKQKRNSWVGIEGIDWDGSGDDLYREIKSDPGALAEDGVIRAVESVDDAAEISA